MVGEGAGGAPSSERPSTEPMSDLRSSAATHEKSWKSGRAGFMAVS